MTDDKRKERIARERAELQLAPWQFAPSEVDDAPPTYGPSTAGYASWLQAQAWRIEIRRRDPHYFDE